MSVLIKGFDKPDHCLRCPVKGIDDECLLQSEAANADYESWEDQMANCPLVPVPPHGDLIDREWTLKQIRPWSPEDEYAACTFDTVKKLMHTLLNDSPTIIPEEPPKEEAPAGTYDLLYEEGGYNSNGV